jgi:hypothetical protein
VAVDLLKERLYPADWVVVVKTNGLFFIENKHFADIPINISMISFMRQSLKSPLPNNRVTTDSDISSTRIRNTDIQGHLRQNKAVLLGIPRGSNPKKKVRLLFIAEYMLPRSMSSYSINLSISTA